MRFMEQTIPHFTFRDLKVEEIDQAFPLAQATGTAPSLPDWQTFALSLFHPHGNGEHGIKALVNSHRTIVGLIVLVIGSDPRHGTVLEVTHLIACDRMSAEALVEEALRIARERECTLVRADVSVGDLWLGDFLRRRFFTLERHQLARALSALPS